MMRISAVWISITAMGLAGCASYTTPGGAISIPEITEVDIGGALAREPAAEFPVQLNTTSELRTAAAQLRGDVILLYTLDTSFRTDTLRIGPLQAVSLGFFPNKKAHVTATCAVAFIDVRTGYIYGVAEATATEEQRSNLWNTQAAIKKREYWQNPKRSLRV